jgi:hypothetical protein
VRLLAAIGFSVASIPKKIAGLHALITILRISISFPIALSYESLILIIFLCLSVLFISDKMHLSLSLTIKFL